MKYEIQPSNQFKKDVKLAQKRGYDIKLLKRIILTLAEGSTLEAKYKDHALTGNFDGFHECHIRPDWLLVYKINHGRLVLLLARTGTHSDLFKQ